MALMAVPALVAILLIPTGAVIAGHSLDSLAIAYRPESWTPIFQGFFVFDNWHLLGYFAVLALAVTILKTREAVPLLMVILSAIALFLFLYLFTSNAFGAVRFTSLNRVALHFMPSVAFFCLVVLGLLAGDKKLPARHSVA